MKRTCEICGKEFSAVPSSPQKTCSVYCGARLRNKNKGLYIPDIAPGYTIGMLTVVREIEKGRFLCTCECGNKKIICKHALNRRDRPTRSCGCLKNKCKQPERKAIRASDKRSSTGVVGVSVHGSQYLATIGYKGKQYHLGVYNTIYEAGRIRKEAEEHKYIDFEEWYKRRKNEQGGRK